MKHAEKTLAKKIQKNSPYLLAGIVGGVVAIFSPFIMMIVSAATDLTADKIQHTPNRTFGFIMMRLIWSIGIAAGMFICHPRIISIILGILDISTIAISMRASELPSLACTGSATSASAVASSGNGAYRPNMTSGPPVITNKYGW